MNLPSKHTNCNKASNTNTFVYALLLMPSLLFTPSNPGISSTPSDHQTRRGLARLDQSLSTYFAHGIATSIQGAYLSGQRTFCAKFNVTLSERTLYRFVAFPLSPQTIHSYISAVRHLHISYGFSDPSLQGRIQGYRFAN